MIVGGNKFEMRRAEWKARNSVKSWCRNFEFRGWKFRWNFYIAVWRQISFYFGKPKSFLLSSSTDWMRATHILEDKLLYSKSIDSNVNNTYNIPLQQRPDYCLTKQLGTIVESSLPIKLMIIEDFEGKDILDLIWL